MKLFAPHTSDDSKLVFRKYTELKKQFYKIQHSSIKNVQDLKGSSLALQWLRLCAFNSRYSGLILVQGTKIPQAAYRSQKSPAKIQNIFVTTEFSLCPLAVTDLLSVTVDQFAIPRISHRQSHSPCSFVSGFGQHDFERRIVVCLSCYEYKCLYIHLLEKEMATHSSILAWRTHWTEEPTGSQRVRHDRVTSTSYIHL